jgi:hypothetical protein
MQFDGLHADVLITHEAPDHHLHGFAAITRLAETLGIKAAFHRHHHENITYPNSVWRAVGLRQIVAYHWDGRCHCHRVLAFFSLIFFERNTQ